MRYRPVQADAQSAELPTSVRLQYLDDFNRSNDRIRNHEQFHEKPLRFISIAASMAALATLTACVAPQPIYETSRQPYHAQHYVAAQGPYVEYGRIANIEVIRSETRGAGLRAAERLRVDWSAVSWATSSDMAADARR